MNMTSIGDLAQGLMLRSRSAQLKQSIATLTDEMSTGRTGDISSRLGGDYSYLADIERSLTRLNGFSVAASETALIAEALQINIGQMHEKASELGNAIASTGQSNLSSVRDNLGQMARSNLDSTIGSLNAAVGGRSIFSGTATDRAPLADAGTLLDELKLVVAGAATADDIMIAAENWFSDPAGFRALMYFGSDQSLAPVQVAPGEQVALSMRADDQAFRDMLRNMAMAGLATDPSLGLDADTQKELQLLASDGLMSSQDEMAGLRADLGFAQARIEEASTRNASARMGLEYTKETLLEADPYETATRLQDAQFRLESLYAVTVRSSRLSLLNFLK